MFPPFAFRLRLVVGVAILLGTARVGLAQTTEIPGPGSVVHGPAAQFISGNLRTPDGPVSGASIRLTGPGQVSVTNEDGNFYFTLPNGTGPQAAIISYSGGKDVPLTLAPGAQSSPVEVPAVQRTPAQERALKKAMKYGHRQGRKDARRLN